MKIHGSIVKEQGVTFAIIIVIVAIAVICDQLWRAGGRSLFPYRRKA